MPRIPPHKSILIVRLSAVGEIVMASPMAERLKAHYPDSHIAWLTESDSVDLLRGNPSIDEVIVWQRSTWNGLLRHGKLLALWREIQNLSQLLRSKKFDIALDLQGLFKSGFLAWLSNAKIRLGLGSIEGSDRFMHKTISRNMGEQNFIGAEYRYLLNQIGVSDSPWKMYVPVSKEAEGKTLSMLRERIGNDPYMVICPFTMRRQKQWFDDSWQQLILRVRAKYKFRAVILGDPCDEMHGEKIAKDCGAINLAGNTSLQQTAAVIKNASLLIGVDTGFTHMGHAFLTPTLALFGSSCPYSYSGTETSKVIHQDLPCSPCHKQPACNGPFGCIRMITPDKVLSEVKQLIKLIHEKH